MSSSSRRTSFTSRGGSRVQIHPSSSETKRLSVTYKRLFELKKPMRQWMPFQKRRYEYGVELGRGAFGAVVSAKLRCRLPAPIADLSEDQLDPAQIAWLKDVSEVCTEKARFTLRKKDEGNFLFACKAVALHTDKDRYMVNREVSMLELCRGPRVLMLIEHFEVKKTSCHIITNRCYGTIGKRLGDDLAPQWIMAQRARKWSAQLLRAVVHVHWCGVVHCDVKPTNVFCSSAGYDSDCVLGDFGLAKEVNSVGKVQAAGSWGYWDVAAFDGFMTTDSDLWAVGISVLELCRQQKLEKAASALRRDIGCIARKMGENIKVKTDARSFYKNELQTGFATKVVKEGGLLDQAGLRAFLMAILDVNERPTTSELLALLPDTSMLPTT